MTFLGLLKVELSDKGEILKILKHAILVQICRESERERWNSGESDCAYKFVFKSANGPNRSAFFTTILFSFKYGLIISSRKKKESGNINGMKLIFFYMVLNSFFQNERG